LLRQTKHVLGLISLYKDSLAAFGASSSALSLFSATPMWPARFDTLIDLWEKQPVVPTLRMLLIVFLSNLAPVTLVYTIQKNF
jgi:hypothetical protein